MKPVTGSTEVEQAIAMPKELRVEQRKTARTSFHS